MKEKTKFVAFSTQKGGAGKTTLTVLAASYLHYVKGFNVAVIDCDYPQHSIVEMRERDLKLALEDEHYKRLAYEQFTRLQKKAYPVVESNTKEALADAEMHSSAAPGNPACGALSLPPAKMARPPSIGPLGDPALCRK